MTSALAFVGAATALVVAVTGLVAAFRGLRQGQANGRALNGHKLATDRRAVQLEQAIVALGGTVPKDPALTVPAQTDNPGGQS